MIDKDNFRQLLKKIDFAEEHKNIFTKSFGSLAECVMTVDWNKGELIYPAAVKINDKTTCNFEKPENFVVFECVHRLLEKGYRPEHIELEKRWNLGHDTKGGKADVCVYDQSGKNMLLIIECKTAGKYDKALKILKEDGGQLFSYLQQERSTQWIALYASDWKNDEISYKCEIINCQDDANILKMEEKDNSVLLYKKAYIVNDYFLAWKETYGQKIWQGLIFGQDTQAYKIGVRPLMKKDLKDFDPTDKIVNRFEEILRHNNVSDKENAFNRLVALFICKLVDEIKKQENDIVEFQYQQGSDTYESLQDRLQRLHTEGMQDFMGEKIFYVSNDYAENLFSNYSSHKRKNAIDDLKNTIRILKFYSNNDFSFKDVHNEELFFQNGKILVEVVQLFENHRIVYPSKHQFLGDLFEQLLGKGFKQSEGQFFTPTPITRFIWDSLPLTKIPKVIDYACGSGHFLTEAVESINVRLKTDENNAWVEKHIFGIEKDYRLARVAKISLFMNGAGGGNIIFGDGLENQPEKQIENNVFDILVANPPYSVSAFKSHLKLKNNTFELLSKISNDGSEIETLFVERIAQLLKPQGIAAVVLPFSILSNDSSSYTGAREILLKNFKLRAVVQLGSKTFGATDTNTVVLFLEKNNEPPKQWQLKQDSANSIINASLAEDWEEQQILMAYLQKINVTIEDYKAFTKESASLSNFATCEYLKMYADEFLKLSRIVNLKNNKTFKKLSAQEQTARLHQEFYAFAKPIEADKLLYFALTYQQTTLIVSAPTDNTEQKQFLGYDWSNRKGSEGIQIIQAGGMLYNAHNHNAPDTIAAVIRQSFTASSLKKDLGEKQKYCTLANLSDMIDFSRITFSKAIKLTPDKKIEIRSKYPLVILESLLEPIIGNTTKIEKKEIKERGKYPVITQEANSLIAGYTDNENVINDLPLIVFGDHSCTFKYLDFPFVRGADGTQLLKSNQKNVITKFLYYVLQNIQIENYGKYERHFKYLKTNKIPLPPLAIQRQIVSECEKIDEEYNTSRMSIEEYKKKIAQIFEDLEVVITKWGGVKHRLSDSYNFYISIGRRVLNTEVNEDFNIPVYSANVFEPFGMIDKLLIQDFSIPSILWGIDGDWMVNIIEANQPFYPTDHCGVLRIKSDDILPKYMAWLLEKEGKRVGFSRTYRASIDRIKSLTIQVAPIEEQRKAIKKVEAYEAAIDQAKTVMVNCAERKKAILEKYLN